MMSNSKTSSLVFTPRLLCLTSARIIILVTNDFSDALSPPVGRRGPAGTHRTASTPSTRFAPLSRSFRPSSASWANKSDGVDNEVSETIPPISNAEMLNEGMDRVFDAVDIDGSGAIDLEEYDLHLTSAGYSKDAIQKSFLEIDVDGNGEISKDELQSAITNNLEGGGFNFDADADCPMGYWLDSVRQTCEPLGPMGRISQKLETLGPLKEVYKKITNVFGVDRKALRKKGIPFLLTYSIISNLNGALSLSVAWYMTVKRTGLSPLVPGQKKSLLASYAMIYGALQLLKPFRVAAAVAMSKLSADYLDLTQDKFHCSRNTAIVCQYVMGQVMMGITFSVGVTVVTLLTGVPIWG